jgi:hypothetical protein
MLRKGFPKNLCPSNLLIIVIPPLSLRLGRSRLYRQLPFRLLVQTK